MTADDENVGSGGEDIMGRADALLGRHRLGRAVSPPTEAVPTLTDVVDTEAEIPTLTDIFEEGGMPTDVLDAMPLAMKTSEEALHKVSGDLTSDIDAMVRASLAMALHSHSPAAPNSNSAPAGTT